MTNHEKWRYYMRDADPPNMLYVDWGWYFTVAAALERRVWFMSYTEAVFPNLYVVLTSPAGGGKGIITGPVKSLLESQLHITTTVKPNGDVVPKVTPLLEMGPDDATYESIVWRMNSRPNTRFPIHPEMGEKDGTYTYHPMTLVLDEYGTMFKRDGDMTVRLLLKLFMGGGYDKETKTGTSESFRNGCMNIIGGTTPDQLKELAKYGIFSNGLASRTIFVWAERKPRRSLWIPPRTKEQLDAYADLCTHVGKLTKLIGCIMPTADAIEWNRTEWPKYRDKPGNSNPRLAEYWQRRNLFVMKLAMILMLSDEPTIRPMSAHYLQRAHEELTATEENMHMAYGYTGDNALSAVMTDIVDVLAQRGPLPRQILVKLFYDRVPRGVDDVELALKTLVEGGKINVPEPGKYGLA